MIQTKYSLGVLMDHPTEVHVQSKKQPIKRLNKAQTIALSICEARIESDFGTFIDVGLALAQIQDKGLYRQTHNTFEDYCANSWGWDPPFVDRLMVAAATGKCLTQMLLEGAGIVLPTSVPQMIALRKAGNTKAEWLEMWKKVTSKVKQSHMTDPIIEETIEEIAGEKRSKTRAKKVRIKKSAR